MKRAAGILMTALAILICLMAMRDVPGGMEESFTASRREMALETPAPPKGTISINDADVEELTQLPGVGETLAQAIIEERELHGPYYYPEDITAAKGIGTGKLEGFRELLDMSEGE